MPSRIKRIWRQKISKKSSYEPTEALQNQTKFTRAELKHWHKGFMRDCPNGLLTRKDFVQIYQEILPTKNPTEFANLLFDMFTVSLPNAITFEEFVVALSITSKGSEDEKLEWAFRLYDLDGDGSVSLDELEKMIACTDAMNKNIGESSDPDEDDEDHGDAFNNSGRRRSSIGQGPPTAPFPSTSLSNNKKRKSKSASDSKNSSSNINRNHLTSEPEDYFSWNGGSQRRLTHHSNACLAIGLNSLSNGSAGGSGPSSSGLTTKMSTITSSDIMAMKTPKKDNNDKTPNNFLRSIYSTPYGELGIEDQLKIEVEVETENKKVSKSNPTRKKLEKQMSNPYKTTNFSDTPISSYNSNNDFQNFQNIEEAEESKVDIQYRDNFETSLYSIHMNGQNKSLTHQISIPTTNSDRSVFGAPSGQENGNVKKENQTNENSNCSSAKTYTTGINADNFTSSSGVSKITTVTTGIYNPTTKETNDSFPSSSETNSNVSGLGNLQTQFSQNLNNKIQNNSNVNLNVQSSSLKNISPSEKLTARQRAERIFAELDSDGNGSLDLEEFIAGCKQDGALLKILGIFNSMAI